MHAIEVFTALQSLRPDLSRCCRDLDDVVADILLDACQGVSIPNLRAFALKKCQRQNRRAKRNWRFDPKITAWPDAPEPTEDPRWPAVVEAIETLPGSLRTAVQDRLEGASPGDRNERKRHCMAVHALRAALGVSLTEQAA